MMKKSTAIPLSALAFAAVLAAGSEPAAACGTDAYTGQICVVAGNYCPSNTAELNGQLLSINTYQALYSLMGCAFGGDCRTTFGIPDLRGRAPVQYGQGAGLTSRPFAQPFGQEAVAQTTAMMAAHTHSAIVSGSSGAPAQVKARQVDGGTNVPQPGYVLAQSLAGLDPASIYLNPAATPGTDVPLGGVSGGGAAGTVTIGSNGASQLTPTVPPALAMRYCIVLDGLYPSRP